MGCILYSIPYYILLFFYLFFSFQSYQIDLFCRVHNSVQNSPVVADDVGEDALANELALVAAKGERISCDVIID